MSFLECLVCPRCGREHEKGQAHALCGCGSPLLAQYDLTETLSVSAFYNSMRDDFNRQSPLTSLTPLGDPSLIR